MPGPVIKLSRALKSIEVGGVIEKQTGHQVLDRSQQDGVFRFLVRRSR